MQARQQDAAIAIITLGTAATAGFWAFTVTQVVSGDAAAKMVADANSGNPAVQAGVTYLLAKVHARNTGSMAAALNLADFAATGDDGILRRPVSMAVPTPSLQGTVAAGAESEGWIPLAVDNPVTATLWYDSTIISGNWTNAILAMVDGAIIPAFTAGAAPDASIGSDPANPAGVNDAVLAGDWSVTILRTASGQEVYNMSDYRLQALVQALGQSDSSGTEIQTEIQTWLGVYARITNLSDHAAVFSPNAMELSDPSGDPWDNIMALTAPDPDLSREVLPGATREGWAAFQLRPYVTTLDIRVLPSAVADSARYISLDKVGNGGTSGASSKGSTPEASAKVKSDPLNISAGGTVTINDSQVNLRKEPTSGSSIVAELSFGAVLQVTGEPVEADGHRWYPVIVVSTGESGYVVQDYITPEKV